MRRALRAVHSCSPHLIGGAENRLRQLLLVHALAARFTWIMLRHMCSTSSAIAAMSRAAGPDLSIKLGVAPQSAASAYTTRLVISLSSTGKPASASSDRICLAITDSRVIWVKRQRKRSEE